MAYSKEDKSTETVTEKDLIADVLDKDFKTTILKDAQRTKEDVEKVKQIMCKQNININKERENLKRNHQEILELKVTITQMEILLGGFKGRFE